MCRKSQGLGGELNPSPWSLIPLYVSWFMGCAPMALSEEKAALSNCWRFVSWGVKA